VDMSVNTLVNYDSDDTLSEPDRKPSHEICHLVEAIREIKKQDHNEHTVTLQRERIEHEERRDDANRNQRENEFTLNLEQRKHEFNQNLDQREKENLRAHEVEIRKIEQENEVEIRKIEHEGKENSKIIV
ncbi:28604_t:CDS:1, partial [Dentiscutata erythropus]